MEFQKLKTNLKVKIKIKMYSSKNYKSILWKPSKILEATNAETYTYKNKRFLYLDFLFIYKVNK